MTDLKKSVIIETAFGSYELRKLLGQGGAGRVFGAVADDGSRVAVKVLDAGGASADKRRRFKNETSFLSRTKHPNIVNVSDHGIADHERVRGPFYVMRAYDGSLRDMMQNGIKPSVVERYFGIMLSGVEAAHLLQVVHRDLKPENILYDNSLDILAIADFGIAHFTPENRLTSVNSEGAKLANFQYAAPEQKVRGGVVSPATDIYALGLILNEMFTGTVPQGTGFRRIADVWADGAYLDPIVDVMLSQDPANRPSSIGDLRAQFMRNQAIALATQRLTLLWQTGFMRRADPPAAVRTAGW